MSPKPALYRAFGDKSTLLLKAVERYAMTYGAPRMAAFQAEPDIYKAVTALCEATVNTASDEACGGCMMAAAALGHSERVNEIRSYAAKGLTATADLFAKRFAMEMKAGQLTRTPSAKMRGRLLVDLLQGVQLRAKVGIAREQLLQDVRAYVPFILGGDASGRRPRSLIPSQRNWSRWVFSWRIPLGGAPVHLEKGSLALSLVSGLSRHVPSHGLQLRNQLQTT